MENIYDVIIVGAGPAGLTAAIYSARANLKTLVIEKNKIGSLVMTNKVSNYPGFDTNSTGNDIYNKMKDHCLEFDVEFLNSTLLGFDPYDQIKIVKTDSGNFKCRKIIIATGMGSFWTKKVKGEGKFLGSGVSYCATCDGAFTRNKIVSLVGKGEELAIEALFLTRFAKEVKLFITDKELDCPDDILKALKENEKVSIVTSAKLLEIKGSEDFVEELEFDIHGNKVDIRTDFVFMYIGTKNNLELFGEFADISEKGFIKTDEDMKIRTSGMYAVGDVREKKVRQITTSTSDGTIAAYDLIKELLKEKKKIASQI